jgi:hypothetical protein
MKQTMILTSVLAAVMVGCITLPDIPDITIPTTPATTTTTIPPVPDDVEPTVPESKPNANKPPFTIKSDLGTYIGYPRIYDGRMAKPGEFRGRVSGFPIDAGSTSGYSTAAANFRFGLRGYLEHDLHVQTGYATPDNPRTGCVAIQADGGVVSWAVIPEAFPTKDGDAHDAPGGDSGSKPDETPSGNPDPLHEAIFSTQGAIALGSRPSGFVNNPANSRGKLKIILPGKYSGTVARVVAFGGGVQDQLKRQTPNEYGNRQRYYGSMAPGSYPKNLVIRWDCVVNGEAKDYYYVIADPAKREG